MPRTRAPAQPTQGLFSINDDALTKALCFLSIADCRSTLGATSKHFRAMAASTSLERARHTDRYVLRGNKHGVVHALATACGTREWPTGEVRRSNRIGPFHDELEEPEILSVPPPQLRVTARRSSSDDYAAFFAAAVVYPGDPGSMSVEPWGQECSMAPGCFVEYQLPFKFSVATFRIGFGSCSAYQFKYWTFEAFDGAWKVIYDSGGVTPWVLLDPALADQQRSEPGPHQIFEVYASIPSFRFRIGMQENTELPVQRCMHLRGFDLFGTVLPPWRLD
jgi:hypothetical protein